jgi:hypothetical protein
MYRVIRSVSNDLIHAKEGDVRTHLSAEILEATPDAFELIEVSADPEEAEAEVRDLIEDIEEATPDAAPKGKFGIRTRDDS